MTPTPATTSGPSPTPPLAAPDEGCLRVDGLTVELDLPQGGATLVDDVSFAVADGKTLCLVGESGCGKSLTARSILRLIDPPVRIAPGASVRLGGRDLMALSEEEMRGVRGRDVALIFQEPMSSLNPVYTVGDQVAEAIIWHRRTSRREATDRMIELFRMVGISSPERRIHQYPHELSGGMQQRVMIAMALSCEPKLLIADEPTTALDVTIQAQILDLLSDLQERLGMAILFITHDLGVVADVAHEIAVMYAGSIVETGPARSVLSQPQHPYTEALLRSMPRIGMERNKPLHVIRGMVPSPQNWPAGCRFRSRCEYEFDLCSKTPTLHDLGSQQSACWLARDGRRDAGRGANG